MRPRSLVLLAVFSALGSASPSPLRAQTETDPPATGELEVIRKSADAFESAYQARDAQAIATLFAPAAEFVDGDGNAFHGRAAIEAEFAAYFQSAPPALMRIDMEAVRFVSPGMLTEEGVCYIFPENDAPVTSNRYVLVHAKQENGAWQIASLRSTRDVPATPHEQLKPLEWLVGAWVDEGVDSVVETTWEWSEDGSFLLSRFAVKVDGETVIRGTQRLGWDPLRRQVRSWVFDSAGGFAQGMWTPIGNQWVAKGNGVRADGETASMTTVYERTGADSFMWSVRDRISGGEALPDLTVKVVRRPPAPHAEPTTP